jgi:hypothetical protein
MYYFLLLFISFHPETHESFPVTQNLISPFLSPRTLQALSCQPENY